MASTTTAESNQRVCRSSEGSKRDGDIATKNKQTTLCWIVYGAILLINCYGAIHSPILRVFSHVTAVSACGSNWCIELSLPYNRKGLNVCFFLPFSRQQISTNKNFEEVKMYLTHSFVKFASIHLRAHTSGYGRRAYKWKNLSLARNYCSPSIRAFFFRHNFLTAAESTCTQKP